MKLKVLHLLSSTDYHGAENMATELISQLSSLGIICYVGVFNNNMNSNFEILDRTNDSVESGVIFNCKGKLDLTTVFEIRSYLEINHINIIHSHKTKTNLYALFATVGTKCNLVSTCHNWLGQSYKMRFYAKFDKWILQFYDKVIGVSDDIITELSQNIRADKLYKIENGINLSIFNKTMDKVTAKKKLGFEGKKLIGFVGRLSPAKGVSYMLQALQKLILHGNEVYAIIVGDGNYAETLKEQSQTLGISKYVTFTGQRNDTPFLYSAMDIFVLPSLQEAFPMVVLEAMACGVPVIATEVGDIPNIIENNISGIIVKPKDPEAIKNSIEMLFIDENKALSIGREAATSVTQNFTSGHMAKKYQLIYQELLTN